MKPNPLPEGMALVETADGRWFPAWYLDEIEQLAGGDDTPRLHYGVSVHAVVLARQTAGNDCTQVIAATGSTPDEAIETLYQRVYEWSWKLQTTT